MGGEVLDDHGLGLGARPGPRSSPTGPSSIRSLTSSSGAGSPTAARAAQHGGPVVGRVRAGGRRASPGRARRPWPTRSAAARPPAPRRRAGRPGCGAAAAGAGPSSPSRCRTSAPRCRRGAPPAARRRRRPGRRAARRPGRPARRPGRGRGSRAGCPPRRRGTGGSRPAPAASRRRRARRWARPAAAAAARSGAPARGRRAGADRGTGRAPAGRAAATRPRPAAGPTAASSRMSLSAITQRPGSRPRNTLATTSRSSHSPWSCHSTSTPAWRTWSGVEGSGRAVEPDLALLGLEDAGQAGHERRLARAVLADQRDHLARSRSAGSRRAAR